MNAYLWHGNYSPKSAEGLVKHLFSSHGIKVPNEKLRTDFDTFLFVCRRFVHADWFAVKADLIHYPSSIFRIFLTDELDKSISLVRLSDSILRNMNFDNSTCLEHELPQQTVSYSLIEVADVNSGLLVLVPVVLARDSLVILIHFPLGSDDTYQCRALDMENNVIYV